MIQFFNQYTAPAGIWRAWRRAGILTVALLTAGSQAAETPSPPEFRQVPPLPEVVAAAKAAGIRLEGLTPAAGDRLRPGHGITALVTWTEGKRCRQWLVDLEAANPTPAEKAAADPATRYYTSYGNEITLGGAPVALNIRMAGPWEQGAAGRGSAADIQSRRIVVSGDYLALGLDRLPAMLVKMKQEMAGKTGPSAGRDFNFRDEPFPSAEVEQSRKQLKEKGITLSTQKEDERAFMGSLLALSEFFHTANATPGLQEVLRTVLDVPWWSIVKQGGVKKVGMELKPGERELSPAPWGLPKTAKVYAFPGELRINGKAGLIFQLAATRPRPPLTVSAGVVGFTACAPDGKGPVLSFQGVASRVP